MKSDKDELEHENMWLNAKLIEIQSYILKCYNF